MKELKNRVREYREEKKMSQTELAEKAGISRPYLSRVENGKAEELKYSTIMRISQALNVEPAVIFFI